ncbi:hypothetical protein LTR78_004485 [Recurvomyces mirabilis]|uniref:PWWP domain-containing protein n=1 Tax=Recurvomyces mirabilis TaxID=574656 RepID=A0AAE0WQ81_9PEZI|nr:hypothetical protein LTR78_004485 [Recurvomyces mirabilis]KAK5155849.1 hypothetical protein LTS14_005415 [Recurvomyces mirabilis]
MADEVPATALVDAQPPTSADPGEPIPVEETAPITKEDEEIAGKQATTEVNAPDGGTTEVAVGPSAAETADDATTASGKKEKRKSVSGVPEHKNKKLNKKKSMVSLQLECKPGEHYWARLKGYPPWPAVVCDEQMLPETLLATRPVSTARPDGSLRDDFKEGGKNAKERTFPVMFLSTNEFAWTVNTNLTPLNPEDCKEKPKAKMTKALQDAYQLATENHDIDYYKNLLTQFQEETQKRNAEIAELEAQEAAEREQAAREAEETAANGAGEDVKKEKKKKAPRKSKGSDGDVEMEDAEAPKSSKKRKKEAESDAEGAKPKKTPKVTKLNAPKTPASEASTKKPTTKPKKKVSAPKAEEAEEVAKPQMTEAEKLEQREKAILYLRHRLQKGFLARDQAPQEAEMSTMAEFLSQLETYADLEPAIIRTTKIHKVLKAIVKLSSIPRDEEFSFKKRSAAMLEVWNKKMESEGEGAAAAAMLKEKEAAPVTNGETNGEVKEGAGKEVEAKGAETVAEEADEKIDEKAEELADTTMAEPAVEVPEEKATVPEAAAGGSKENAEVGDVSMQTVSEKPADLPAPTADEKEDAAETTAN